MTEVIPNEPRQSRTDLEDAGARDPGEPGRSGDTKLQRISEQTRGLVDDVKSWVELRMELSQIEVEDRVESKVNEATAGAIVVAVGALAVLFLLVAAAIGLGALLGHAGWGFLIVGGLLLLVTAIVHQIKPRMVRIGKERKQ